MLPASLHRVMEPGHPVGRGLPILVSLLLAVFLARELAQLTWDLIQGPPTELSVSTRSHTPLPPAEENGSSLRDEAERIARLHLFGQMQAGTVEVAPQELAETRLNLELRGVIAYSGEQPGYALISQGRGQEKLYTEGEQLPGGVTLEKVMAEEVILRRGATLERLRLPESALPITRRETALGTPTLASLREQALKNPMALARQADLQPFHQAGKLKGYVIGAGTKAELLRASGLQAGDVIVSINGNSVTDSRNLSRFLRMLRQSDTLELSIIRNGVEMPLSLSLR